MVAPLLYSRRSDSVLCALCRSVPSDQRETASTIMAFFLSGGLLVGGSISFLWTKVVVW